MINGLKSIRKERASLEINRVITESMLQDSKIAEAFENLDDDFFEGVSEYEIENLIERIPESDEEDEQVDRVLNSEKGLNVDEILGVDSEINEEE